MQLYQSVNSPYSRKCRIVAIEKGVFDRLELIAVDTLNPSPEFSKVSPLGRVPTLRTD